MLNLLATIVLLFQVGTLNPNCFTLVDQCWESDPTFTCRQSSKLNYELYGDTIGSFCTSLVEYSNVSNQCLDTLTQYVYRLEQAEKRIRRLKRKLKRYKNV